MAETHVLAPRGAAFAANITHGTYHTLVALEPGTVFFEAKSGPYAAVAADEKACWAPAEEDARESREYLVRLVAGFA